jgi:hypothetical protein
VQTPVAVEKGTKAVISVNFASTADEHSITRERLLLLKFPKKNFSTATPVYINYRQNGPLCAGGIPQPS